MEFSFGKFSFISAGILDTGANGTVVKATKAFYDSLVKNFVEKKSFGNVMNMNRVVTASSSTPGIYISRINNLEPHVTLRSKDSEHSVYIKSLILLPVSLNETRFTFCDAQALIGTDVLCQFKFIFRLYDKNYSLCLDSERKPHVPKNDEVVDSLKGSCGWISETDMVGNILYLSWFHEPRCD